MPVSVHLSASKPEFTQAQGDSLGARLLRRRRQLAMRRVDAAALLGTDPKTLMWWERDIRMPCVRAYPAIIQFLGHEPWPQPGTLSSALLAERRRRGLQTRKAAALIGVDEGTWRRWERGEWKPTRLTLPALDRLFGRCIAKAFPGDVR